MLNQTNENVKFSSHEVLQKGRVYSNLEIRLACVEDGLDVDDAVKEELKKISPNNYTGI